MRLESEMVKKKSQISFMYIRIKNTKIIDTPMKILTLLIPIFWVYFILLFLM